MLERVLVRISELLALFLGAVVVFLAYRGYKRTNKAFMVWLALGFAFLVTGAVIEGLLYELLGVPLVQAHVTRASFTALGFLLVIFSIHKVR